MGGFFRREARAPEPHRGAENRDVVPIDDEDIARRIELLDAFEEAGLGWFWATDSAGRLIYLSPVATEMLGRSRQELIGLPLTDFFLPERGGAAGESGRTLAFLLGARNTINQLPVRLRGADGEVWWEVAAKPQFDARGNFTGYRGSAKDITLARKNQHDAARLAQYDTLTGLANRNSMTRQLDTMLRSFRTSKRSCALILLNLDRFKQVNDTLGQPVGDALLRQVSQRIQRIVGSRGEIGRVGGDEFQVLFPDLDDRGELGEIGQRLIQIVSQPYSIDGTRAIIGTSMGIAIAPYDGMDGEELVKSAGLALFAAKRGGRGSYRFYSSDLKDVASFRRQIEEDLRDALERGELEMRYQPIVEATSHKVCCLEAVMRWNHREHGEISPALFVPVAEEVGLIRRLGIWALNEACRQAQEWPIELKVAVNVSAIQFADDDFPRQVRKILRETGFNAQRLELEITESVFLGDSGRAQHKFEELKGLGVRLALDDFGTGYSSLSYLRTAPFDKIKIDQGFVRGATEKDNNNAAIISAIVGLAGALGMETVAEGVETVNELDLVKARGVSHIQGYIFSRAVPHQDLLDRLAEGKLEYEPKGPAMHRAGRRTLLRKIGLIHDDHRYNVVLRNLSKTGAMIEGLLGVPVGTEVVLDLGDGQLAVAIVRRSGDSVQGLEFEMPLISDGAEGLCTRHRVSPYEIEAAVQLEDFAELSGNEPRAPTTAPRKRFLEIRPGGKHR